MPQSSSGNAVRRRKVFYVPGYDPRPPRQYRELFRAEGAEQARISGYQLDVGRADEKGPHCWSVSAQIDGRQVETEFEVLVWADIVRNSMSQTIAATYWQLLRTGWVYVATGTLRRLMWMRKGPVIAALYPVVVLLFQLLLAMVLGSLLAALGTSILNAGLGLFGLSGGSLSNLIWMGLFIAGLVPVLRWFKSKDDRIYAYYLMHDFAFSASWRGAYAPSLEERLNEFRQQLADATSSDFDEVLVVGHSSGCHLAISFVADMLRAIPTKQQSAELSLLTLGHVVPMVSFLPKANRLRADLRFVSTSNDLTWVDVSAPGDGCSFALCDPVAVSGVATADKRGPLVISAAFSQTLSERKQKDLKGRFFRLHFQYLCAFDQPKDYDYFQITAGPLPLKRRYEGRQPSKSRIDVPASKHTSVAA